jgi:hypothetical protein
VRTSKVALVPSYSLFISCLLFAFFLMSFMYLCHLSWCCSIRLINTGRTSYFFLCCVSIDEYLILCVILYISVFFLSICQKFHIHCLSMAFVSLLKDSYFSINFLYQCKIFLQGSSLLSWHFCVLNVGFILCSTII